MLTLAGSLLLGCDRSGQGFVPAPGGSSVKIVSTSPGANEALRVGETVTLEVGVEYTLESDSGTLALVVQGADNRPIASQMEVVTRGADSLSLKVAFIVPDTNAIQIFTPLSAQGQTGTSTVDTRAFKVTSP